ncbi:MAG: Rrf2 family transcriptional regulator [Planctomycetota bacterium]|nr:Rrf2 family transcriptional regulator [Planctomycetota bacterium]
MLQLTKRTEYGLIALVHLVDRRDEFVSAREIGDAYHVPRRLLAEVLKELCRADLLLSQRGANGGYSLAREPENLTLAEAVQILEATPSAKDGSTCETSAWSSCDLISTCPIKTPIERLRAGIWGLLNQTTLRDLATPAPVNPLGELIESAQASSLSARLS